MSWSFRSRSRCSPCSRRPKQNSPPPHPPKRRGSQAAVSCDPVHKGGATKKRERQSYSTLTLKVCVRCVRRPRRGPHSRSPATGIFYLNAITIPSEEAMKPRRSSRCDGAIALENQSKPPARYDSGSPGVDLPGKCDAQHVHCTNRGQAAAEHALKPRQFKRASVPFWRRQKPETFESNTAAAGRVRWRAQLQRELANRHIGPCHRMRGDSHLRRRPR